MNMLVMIKRPSLFRNYGVKYGYKLVFLQIATRLSQRCLYYSSSWPLCFQKIVQSHIILCLFCYAYSTHSFWPLFLNNSTRFLLLLQELILCFLKKLSFNSFPLFNKATQGRLQVLWNMKFIQFGDPLKKNKTRL